MLLSKLIGERYKEKPNDAFTPSHIFLLRGAYIRQVGSGIFTLLLPGKKVADKVSKIIKEEMDALGAQEVLFPVVIPGELWKQSGRFESVGSELVRIKDRSDKDLVLGMTHEEPAVHVAKSETSSYSQYPFSIYQIQTKFRDEPRSRAGLLRVREFTMKDAYSFHTSQECLENWYQKYFDSYIRIFDRVGLKNYISVKSDSGMMGGKVAHEFMLINDHGEDKLAICDNCGYRSNLEVAEGNIKKYEFEDTEIEELLTPDLKDIESVSEYFGRKPYQAIKATIFIKTSDLKPVIVFIRGDLQVNEVKVSKAIGEEVVPMLDEFDKFNIIPGFVGPYNYNFTDDVTLLYDNSLQDAKSMTAGANKKDYHFKGVSFGRDIKVDKFYDFAEVSEQHLCIECGANIKLARGIEIGNIFQLGKKYTESMEMTYLDKDGKTKIPTMGCYGIGVGRTLACIIEEFHDDYGPIWPIQVAPYHVHINILGKGEELMEKGLEIYNNLNKDYETLCDDRGMSAGVQFSDADLLGVPIRLVLSKKKFENGEIEVTTRDKSYTNVVKIDKVYDEVAKVYDMLWSKVIK